ncbi:lysophospholipase-like protein 1 [Diachasma alloeum]|uniref:lysophospholipase-like protein 1 n=1 Tax=Diachasma alloeum TaxID=454923 RepID=UPI0007383F24|nr:lysophospholipase-like protein 1 [Diachasma alloeum]
MATRLPKMITVAPSGKHSATLFFFHGSGSSGADVKEWLDILNRKELKFPNVKVVYPTAPSQPYTPLDGMPSNVWFDRKRISIRVPEIKESIDKMCKETSKLIEEEVESGIPENRIVVGGFSMGGALAMHFAYRFKRSLAGCVAMSSFLNDNSVVYEELKDEDNTGTPPLLQFHGLADAMVPFQWGEKTHKILKELGVAGEFVQLPGVEHEIVKTEVVRLTEWLAKVLPETP